MKTVAALREIFNTRFGRSEEERANVMRVFAAMEEHNLEAAHVVVFNTCTRIYWHGGFNKNHEASIACDAHRIIGRTYTVNEEIKTWQIEGPPTDGLEIPLDETLEHIRHWIWANHETA
jgi:hypothetical protein